MDAPLYITAGTALNVPRPGGDVADWHTEGMIRSGKLLVAGRNYSCSPGLEPDDLFDAGAWIERRGPDWPTHLCATPERAVLDMLYHQAVVIGRLAVPYTIDLDDMLVDADRAARLARGIRSWIGQADPELAERLRGWMAATPSWCADSFQRQGGVCSESARPDPDGSGGSRGHSC